MIMNRALINFPQNRFYLKTWRWPEIVRHEPHNSAIISQRSKNEGWNNQGFKAPRHRGFISWGGPSWKFTTWLSYLDTIFQETVHALIRIQRLFGHHCLCVSTQLKFYKAAIKFHDDNDCKMADAVIVAAMATKRPWGRVKLMKCGAISKKGFLINGNHFILIIFFCLTLQLNLIITAWPSCGEMMQTEVTFQETPSLLPQHTAALTLVIVHMLPYKLKLHEIPSILSLGFMLCLGRWSER